MNNDTLHESSILSDWWKQVDKWLNLFEKSFGNTSLDRIYIPSFDCSWNFASSINK